MRDRLLLAMDIDGTAVGKSCRVGAKTRDAFRRFQQEGHLLCFNSGRHSLDMANMKGDEHMVDYLITNSGGTLTRMRDGCVLMHRLADPEDTRELIRICLGTDCVLYTVAGDQIAVNRITDGVREYMEWANFTPYVYSRADEVPVNQVVALMASGDLRTVLDAIDRRGLAFEYSYCEPGAIDITPKGVNKWTALQELARVEDISPENIVAAGNYLNDMSMVANAGLGVAVSNAVPEIRAAAALTLTSGSEQDAMAELINILLQR